MKVLIAGAGGLIGSAAASYLSEQGDEVIRLVRRKAGSGEVHWDPDGRTIDAAGLEGFDAVVHVASMSRMLWRWPAAGSNPVSCWMPGTLFASLIWKPRFGMNLQNCMEK